MTSSTQLDSWCQCHKVGPGFSFGSGLYEVIGGANSRVTGLYSVDRSFVGPIGLG